MMFKSVMGVTGISCFVLGILLMGAHFEFDERIVFVRSLHYPGYVLLMVGVVLIMIAGSSRAGSRRQ